MALSCGETPVWVSSSPSPCHYPGATARRQVGWQPWQPRGDPPHSVSLPRNNFKCGSADGQPGAAFPLEGRELTPRGVIPRSTTCEPYDPGQVMWLLSASVSSSKMGIRTRLSPRSWVDRDLLQRLVCLFSATWSSSRRLEAQGQKMKRWPPTKKSRDLSLALTLGPEVLTSQLPLAQPGVSEESGGGRPEFSLSLSAIWTLSHLFSLRLRPVQAASDHRLPPCAERVAVTEW